MSRTVGAAVLGALLVLAAACGGTSVGSHDNEPSSQATRPELQISQESVRLLRSESTSITVGVTGMSEADWPVSITLNPLPEGVSVGALYLRAERMSGELKLRAGDDAAPGIHHLEVVARGGDHELRRTLQLEISGRGLADAAWGQRGSATLSVRNSERLTEIAVDDTGRVYASLQDRAGGLRVLRFNSDGTPDERFGADGFASLDAFEAGAILAQQDGLLVAGSTQEGTAVARLDDQGILDASFGERGIAALGATGSAVAIRAGEGRIHVAGGDRTLFVASLDGKGAVLALGSRSRNTDRSPTATVTADAAYFSWDEYDDAEELYESSLIKSDLEGAADLSFAADGIDDIIAPKVTADARGGIIACGFKGSRIPVPAALRFEPDGARDRNWGTVQLPISTGTGGCWRVVQAGDGLLAAAGAANLEETVFELFLLSDDGRIDSAFGEQGALRFRLAPLSSTAIAADRESVFVGSLEDRTLTLRRYLL